MPTVQRFEDLQVWQEARQLVGQVYQLTAEFPRNEEFGLANQMRRAAVSVMANIAEGFERGANTEFVQFLYIARGSCGELRSHAYIALDMNYADEAVNLTIRDQCETLSRKLKALIDYLKRSEYKGAKFHDERIPYEVEEPGAREL